jgi:hypothetical protein
MIGTLSRRPGRHRARPCEKHQAKPIAENEMAQHSTLFDERAHRRRTSTAARVDPQDRGPATAAPVAEHHSAVRN